MFCAQVEADLPLSLSKSHESVSEAQTSIHPPPDTSLVVPEKPLRSVPSRFFNTSKVSTYARKVLAGAEAVANALPDPAKTVVQGIARAGITTLDMLSVNTLPPALSSLV